VRIRLINIREGEGVTKCKSRSKNPKGEGIEAVYLGPKSRLSGKGSGKDT